MCGWLDVMMIIVVVVIPKEIYYIHVREEYETCKLDLDKIAV